ncbi:MAG: DNA repair protein RadA [Patescibacteria group bacterium]
MPTNYTIFECSNCGAQYPKWQGRCNECGAWGTLTQTQEIKKTKKSEISITPDQPLNLGDLSETEQTRLKTDIDEFDRVLGGGIVRGSLILLGGDPGIGKSTLILQVAEKINGSLYISGEESAEQIKMRAHRLNLNLANLKFLPQTDTAKIIATIKEIKPALAIIDSIQTMRMLDDSTSQGTIAQTIASASRFLELAKETNIPVVIVGHVTKDGVVAGPKTLEHLVDAVIYLENDSDNYYKILRAAKNRFGSVGEIGVFEMTALGLKEIKNPTEIFFSRHQGEPVSGSAATVTIEGLRPFLVEVQALASRTSFGYPQRRATGFDLNRLQMITAVIAKIAKLNLANHDIYLNVAGGLKIKETAIDLAVAAAIISAFLEKPIEKKTLFLGEVGLNGEVRSVPQMEKRIKEAVKLGFDKIIAPPDRNFKTATQNILTINNVGELVRIINAQN